MDRLPDDTEALHEPDEDPVEASHHIDDRLAESDSYKEMGVSLRRQRFLSFFMAILVGINVVLSVTAIWAAVHANNAANQASLSLSQQHATCVANNEFRTQDHKRWLYIESLFSSQNLSPAYQQAVQKFEHYIEKTDQLRDCSQVK